MPPLVLLADERRHLMQVLGFDRAELQPTAACEIAKQDQAVMHDVQIGPVAGCNRLTHTATSGAERPRSPAGEAG
ncbi:unnamed protein product [Gemmataceae bacterium]|nr:unnamed protein product [Gemmataceae bacterium]VTU02186.1 unnamed protein product [Gemmataceae bacterium]